MRFRTQRLVHRVRRDRIVLERSEKLIRGAEIELAVDLVVEKVCELRLPRRRSRAHRVMANRAADTVSR